VQYQERFSETHPEMYDAGARRIKAAKVMAILEDHFSELAALRLLDFGCSNGLMTGWYGERFQDVVGVDIDVPGITYAIAQNQASNVRYELIHGIDSRQPDASFDVVTCTHVYEHVPDPTGMLAEIRRVLRPGGACVFIAGNRLAWMEADNGLPMLSLLPRPLADRYMRLAGRGDRYHERLFTVWGLRRLVADFDVIDYTIRVVREPERFRATDVVSAGSFRQRAALGLMTIAYWACPTFIWLLIRRD
jgi:SAM-dependent methyltransferase